ncbi:hypothetical protein DRO61_08480, partial [Candidatus Bathyarchaeota archaeon]
MAFTVDQFAEKIKTKYPSYQDMDNTELVDKITTKYPQYSEQIDFDEPSRLESAASGFMEAGGRIQEKTREFKERAPTIAEGGIIEGAGIALGGAADILGSTIGGLIEPEIKAAAETISKNVPEDVKEKAAEALKAADELYNKLPVQSRNALGGAIGVVELFLGGAGTKAVKSTGEKVIEQVTPGIEKAQKIAIEQSKIAEVSEAARLTEAATTEKGEVLRELGRVTDVPAAVVQKTEQFKGIGATPDSIDQIFESVKKSDVKISKFDDLRKVLEVDRKDAITKRNVVLQRLEDAGAKVSVQNIITPAQKFIEDLKGVGGFDTAVNTMTKELLSIKKAIGNKADLGILEAEKMKEAYNAALSKTLKKGELTIDAPGAKQAMDSVRQGLRKEIEDAAIGTADEGLVKQLNKQYGALRESEDWLQSVAFKSKFKGIDQPSVLRQKLSKIPFIGDFLTVEGVTKANKLEGELAGLIQRIRGIKEGQAIKNDGISKTQTRIDPKTYSELAEEAGFRTVKTVGIDEIKPTQTNPNPERVKFNEELIKEGKEIEPIIVSKDGKIVDGNHRYHAYKS